MIAGAPSIAATTAFDSPMTAPTPAWPVPSIRSMSWSAERVAWARDDLRAEVLDDLAGDVRLREAARDVDRAHDRSTARGRPNVVAHQDGVLVGRLAVVDDGPLADRLHEPGSGARAAGSRRTARARPWSCRGSGRSRRGRAGASGAGARPRRPRGYVRAVVLRSISATPSRERVTRLGVDRVGLEVRPEPLHDVGDEPEEHGRVGDEELRLVVVADERQAALEDAALLDVGDLGREVVALDPVGVVQEVQGVVDREAEAGAPRDEALVDLRRDADLGDLVEDLGRDGQQPDERRAGPRRRASPGGCARG